MERAVARIDFDAIRANCARLKAELGDGAELCAVVKADGYGHGADACAGAALAGGATRLAVATAGEAEQIGRRYQHIPLLTMGALTAEEVDVVLSAGSEVAVWREGFRAAARRPRPRPGPPGPRSRQVRQRHGTARQPRPRGGARPGACLRCRPAASSWPASGPISRPPTNPTPSFFDEQLGRFEAVAAAVKAEFPAAIAHAANSAAVFRDRALPFRHGPLRGRHLRPRPLPGRPRRARPGAGALAALLRRRRQALRGRRQRRLRAALDGAGGHLGRRGPARLWRRRPPRPHQQRRGAGRRAPPSRWSAPSRWTT